MQFLLLCVLGSMIHRIGGNRFLETLNGPCEHTFPDGSTFNLKPLVRTPGRDDYVTEDAEKRMYFLNVCANVQNIPHECRVLGKLMGSPGYVVRNNSQCHWLGTLGEHQWELIDANDPNLGVSLQYFKGERCASNAYRQLQLRFFCDPVGEMGGVSDYLVEEVEELCLYRVTFPSKFGCPVTSVWTFGWTVVSLFVSAVLIYLGGGIAYNVVQNNMPISVEAIPHKAFWLELPDLVKEGITYTMLRLSSSRSSETRENFAPIGSAHQTSDNFEDLDQYEWG